MSELALTSAIELMERGVAPDLVIRLGIRRLLQQRLEAEAEGGPEFVRERQQAFVRRLRESPIAIDTDKANAQHYEVPSRFFELCLGKRLKYSSCLFEREDDTLDLAEERMLALSTERAGIEDGMRILDLGCGWGSLSLWLAERFPQAQILGVSNSATQRAFIERRAHDRELDNLRILTRDANELELDERFDRIVSVEMLEHVRNYQRMFERLAGFLAPGGRVFVHVFAHTRFAYPFETEGADNWMGRHFFSGGQMPSEELFLSFQDHLRLRERWSVSGTHYSRTARAWLQNLDARQGEVLALFRDTYGAADAERWLQRWRIFFMCCEELWGFRGGSEWLVAHYLFDGR
jgi:cyclopropane-fatty-acyl-phospholipid synthase